MSSLEAKAEEYYQKRPEGFGYPRYDFMAGYRQAIKDSAALVRKQAKGEEFPANVILEDCAQLIEIHHFE